VLGLDVRGNAADCDVHFGSEDSRNLLSVYAAKAANCEKKPITTKMSYKKGFFLYAKSHSNSVSSFGEPTLYIFL
jgi:hypothetical protein